MKNRPKGRFFYVLNIDQLGGNLFKTQNKTWIDFTVEMDRIYPRTIGKFELLQNQEEYIQSDTSSSAVIWNPWIEKTARMADIHNDAWQDFVCIEGG